MCKDPQRNISCQISSPWALLLTHRRLREPFDKPLRCEERKKIGHRRLRQRVKELRKCNGRRKTLRSKATPSPAPPSLQPSDWKTSDSGAAPLRGKKIGHRRLRQRVEELRKCNGRRKTPRSKATPSPAPPSQQPSRSRRPTAAGAEDSRARSRSAATIKKKSAIGRLPPGPALASVRAQNRPGAPPGSPFPPCAPLSPRISS